MTTATSTVQASASTAAGALDTSNLLGTPLSALLHRPPLTLSPDASIQEAAQAMQAAGVSSVLLMQGEALYGLVTDRDLRSRVVAQCLDARLPVREIASTEVLSLPASTSALDALTWMARHNIHHVPVQQDGRIVGMITPRDVSEHQTPTAVQLARRIHQASSVAELAALSAQVGPVQQTLARTGAAAHSIGRMVTAITDTITVRLIGLAQQELGPAPIDWVWVAAGSQARMEQTARTDQDNCMVLSDDYQPEVHGAYFEALARWVCDGLDACGYVYCPGEMMAMTDQWRQPLAQWRRYFRRWIDQPEPQALMLSSVFFDLRAIHGNSALLEQLRAEELSSAQGNRLFLGHMVGNALKQRPPLGWLGAVVGERKGEHAGAVDFKHGGVVPIVDLARVYALSGGLDAVNTHERLAQAAALEGGELSPAAGRDLQDALTLISGLRLAHQTRQAERGEAPDNYVPLASLSRFERGQLKQAMTVVKDLQAVLARRYQMGR